MKLAGLLILCGTTAFSQVAAEANKDYQNREGRSRIAAGLASESRDARQKPKELVAAMGIQPGMTVADVGTGAGYMLKHLLAAVGPGGLVYAEDVFPDFIETAKKSAGDSKNVKYVLGNSKSSELPENAIDVMLVLDAYHHFDYPAPMMASLGKALKANGKLVVVEYHKNEKAMANGRALQHIRATRDEFVKEIESHGFRAAEVKDFVPEVQWIGIFTRR